MPAFAGMTVSEKETQYAENLGPQHVVNVQKAMWAIGEFKLAHERIDVGGPFGKNKEPAYLAMNPNGLVPTLEEEDGFLLWESNSIVRYLAGKHDKRHARTEGPRAARTRQPMDGLAAVGGRAGDLHAFWGLIRTPPEKRDLAAIKTSQDKTTDAMQMLDAQLGKTELRRRGRRSRMATSRSASCVTAIVQLVPGRPPTPNLDRWYAAISSRPAFKDHVGSVPLS